MKKRKLLYLHGFNSSPQSHKVQLLQQYMQQHNCIEQLICPQLPVEPLEAKNYLEQLIETTLKADGFALAGSSLGGYYAAYLAEKYNTTAVLINPSIKPYETLQACLGENTFYHDNISWTFTQDHIDQLKLMKVENGNISNRYLVLLQTGDEVLDYREAQQKFCHNQKCIIEQGGNHSFENIEQHFDEFLCFSQII